MTPLAAHVEGCEKGSGVAGRQVEAPEYIISRDIAAVFVSWNLAGFHSNATFLNVSFGTGFISAYSIAYKAG